MWSVDSETTGLDHQHGARPFYVSIGQEDGTVEFYEWPVDWLTRQPAIPPEDVRDLNERLARVNGWGKFGADVRERHVVVGQNLKFDVAALRTIGVRLEKHPEGWPWGMTRDTLIAGHLLASNQPHNLTDMALHYLGVNIEPYELRIGKAVQECRRLVQQSRLRLKRKLAKAELTELEADTPLYAMADYQEEQGIAVEPEPLAAWAIAQAGADGMPSAKDKTWKYDMWLPRAMALHQGLPEPEPTCEHKWAAEQAADGTLLKLDQWLCSKCGGHRWWVILQEYANADTAVTLPLWQRMYHELQERKLWDIYLESQRVQVVITDMEKRGVTGKRRNAKRLKVDFAERAAQAAECCVKIAASLGYELTLPKGGSNKSLSQFCFGVPQEGHSNLFPNVKHYLQLPIIKRTPNGNPSFDKTVLEEYVSHTLPRDSVQLQFIQALVEKRTRDTALGYLESYEKFMLPWWKRPRLGYKLGQVQEYRVASADPVIARAASPAERDAFILYPSVNQTGTDTLRMSMANPNGQQISKKGLDVVCPECTGDGCTCCGDKGRVALNLRYVFGPAPGREWWPMDYENIELRIPAYRANEQAMIELFEHPNDPPYYGSNHLLNCSAIYRDVWEALEREVGYERVGPEFKTRYKAAKGGVQGYYQDGKNTGFCKQYGGQRAKTDATAKRVGAFDALENTFKGLATLNQSLMRFAEKHGYVETLPDKTVDPARGYPLLCTRTDRGAILPTVPLSYCVQGTAMWCTRRAMVRWHTQLSQWRAEGFDGYITLQVHDEIIPDFPVTQHCMHASRELARGCLKCGGNGDRHDPEYTGKPANYWRAQVLRKLMEKSGEDISVPLKVSVSYCPQNWGEAQEV